MNLQDFVQNVLVQINQAVDDARLQTSRNITFSEKNNARTIEFDVAVSAEDVDKKSGKAGIKVLRFAEAGGDIGREVKNATVSRITFGLRIEPLTREEQDEEVRKMRERNMRNKSASW